MERVQPFFELHLKYSTFPVQRQTSNHWYTYHCVMYPQRFVIDVLVIQVPLPSLSMTILKICLPTDLPIVVDVFCRHSVRRTSPVGEFFVRSSRSRDNDCLELRIYINMIVCWILHTVVVSCFRTTILLMEKSSEIASRKTEYNASMDWSRTFSDVSYTCQPSHTWFSCVLIENIDLKHIQNYHLSLTHEFRLLFHIKCLQVISKFKNFRCYWYFGGQFSSFTSFTILFQTKCHHNS